MAWVEAEVERAGGQILLFRPSKDVLKDQHPRLDQLLRRTGAGDASWKVASRTWAGGPVIAAWPDLEHLGKIGDKRRVTALCVLPWGHDGKPWLRGMGATYLGGADHDTPLKRPVINEPVVERAMLNLSQISSVNHGLAGRERDFVVSAYLKLHSSGYSWEPTELYGWAIEHGWCAEAAFDLKRITADIGSGKKMRVKGDPFRADITEVWKKGIAAHE